MAPLIAILGGVRASAFAAALGVALVALWVRGDQLEAAELTIAKRDATIAVYGAANESNTRAIRDLSAANQRWRAAASSNRANLAAAVEHLNAANTEASRALETERQRRADIYRENPNAQSWADRPVPAAVADSLHRVATERRPD